MPRGRLGFEATISAAAAAGELELCTSLMAQMESWSEARARPSL